jgi:hypothetical protein
MYYAHCVDASWLRCRSFRLPNLHQSWRQHRFPPAAAAASIASAALISLAMADGRGEIAQLQAYAQGVDHS